MGTMLSFVGQSVESTLASLSPTLTFFTRPQQLRDWSRVHDGSYAVLGPNFPYSSNRCVPNAACRTKMGVSSRNPGQLSTVTRPDSLPRMGQPPRALVRAARSGPDPSLPSSPVKKPRVAAPPPDPFCPLFDYLEITDT